MAVCLDDKPVERMSSCSCSDSSCCNKEPESGFYEEARLHPRSDEESDEWISEEELSSAGSDHGTSADFTCRAESEGTSTGGLTTPSDVSRNLDDELQPVSLHLRLDFCLFCRDQALDDPIDGHHSSSHSTHVLAEQDLKPVSGLQAPVPCVSVGCKTPSAHEPAAPSAKQQLFVGELPCVPCGQSHPGDSLYKASAAKPSPERSGATPSCSAVTKGEPAQSSASDALIQTAPPKRHFAVLKRIRKFLSRIAACFHSRFGRRPSKWCRTLCKFLLKISTGHRVDIHANISMWMIAIDPRSTFISLLEILVGTQNPKGLTLQCPLLSTLCATH